MKVELFVPCIIDQFFPEVAVHTMKVLARTGVEVEYNPEQTCCGRFAYNAGFVEDAKELTFRTTARWWLLPPPACITSRNIIPSFFSILPTT